MRVEVSRYVFAPPDVIWDVLVDWERQADWMVDALDVEILSDQREGVGVRLRCPTRLLGLTVNDEMEVTAWEPPRRLRVDHLGRVIRGWGEFELTRTRIGTHLVWREEIPVPGALLVRPYVRWLFGRSLDNLKQTCERVARQRRVGEED